MNNYAAALRGGLLLAAAGAKPGGFPAQRHQYAACRLAISPGAVRFSRLPVVASTTVIPSAPRSARLSSEFSQQASEKVRAAHETVESEVQAAKSTEEHAVRELASDMLARAVPEIA